MRAKDIIPTSKPRNFVAKNQKTSGAGAHKDKKKAAKQGDVKHKKQSVEETALRDKEDLQAKRKALYDLETDPVIIKEPSLMKAVQQRKLDLEKEAKAKGLAEGGFGRDAYQRDYDSSVSGFGRRNREDDWDEGNTEPPNNFAITINGKKWKVFQGQGTYADDYREMAQYRRLQDMCRRKTEQTGKKWEVYRTGEKATA